jgi:hypothetical protein
MACGCASSKTDSTFLWLGSAGAEMYGVLILLNISIFPAYGLMGLGAAFVAGGLFGILGYWHLTRIV